MKNYVTNLIMVMAVVLLFIASCSTSTKYDFIKTDPEVEKMLTNYNKYIKSSALIMNYLNTIVSSPTDLYLRLKDQDCDKEILKFVENNKSLALILTHVRMALILNEAKVHDNEIIFVTNWITSPESKLATVAEQTQANMLLQGMSSFVVYQEYTKPGGLKTQTEELFQWFLENHKT